MSAMSYEDREFLEFCGVKVSGDWFLPTGFLRFRLLPADASRQHQRSVLEQLWRCGDMGEWRLVPRVDEHGDPAPLEGA